MITSEKFNVVIDYIENHICEKLELIYLASIANCPVYDFQRTFAFIAEISIIEYIRKRRLTLAGLELQNGDIKVIDAAVKYGYDSPVSFARAFQAMHGITPLQAKKSNSSLKIFPRIAFQMYIKEVNEVKIQEKDEMYLCGFHIEPNGGDLWEKYGRVTAIYEQPELIDWAAYEARFYPPEGEWVFTGCRQKEKADSPYYELLSIPAALWAVFDIDHKIDKNPQYAGVNEWINKNKNIYKRIKWDAGGHIKISEFAIYWYDHQNKFGKERIMEMWIPVEKMIP